jgi:acetyl/propionyl-CoA carboxylase alpha subunit
MALQRLFIANRGDAAVRVARTCRRLGIETVGAVTPDDRHALHARVVDATAEVSSYLSVEEVVRSARDTRAEAVHPGWGFLAEQAELADAVGAAGLVWVGPPPAVMRLAADKLEAKRVAASLELPTLRDGTPDEVGFPLLIKAAAGGGGRGMRVVRSQAELDEALAAAEREARSGFGEGRIFCEELVERARHIEVQILGDRRGAVSHLGERDCSVQRRHQKVLEETPAPGLSGELRRGLCDAAVGLARELGYENAGTVEFLVSGDRFWFIELNARLQVEHPVTELVTGLDLVEQQLRLAVGEELPTAGPPKGHAVEARLYAEHPLTLLPQAGRVRALTLPEGIRVDASAATGDEVSAAYDPLLAKLVAGGPTRAAALDVLADALRETRVEGVTTNLPFLRWLVAHPEVRAGHATTAFLREHPPFSRHRPPHAPWAGYWRPGRDPSLPPPVPAPPPAVELATHAVGGHDRATVAAPMPGLVARVLVTAGDRVTARQPLVVLEAMKMETPLTSPFDALVSRVLVAEGDQVAAGAVLVELEE